MAEDIQPVLMCGGAGTRLWPLSREDAPKQFQRLLGPESLFQATARRFSGPGYAAPIVLTHADLAEEARAQLAEIGQAPAAVLLEPARRNTGPAVLAAALLAAETTPDRPLLVTATDHAVADPAAFRAAVALGAAPAASGDLVTFGVRPDRAETGYGYLEVPTAPAFPSLHAPKRFVEKPDAATAADMLADGRYLWNAGVFLGTAATFVAAFATHAPELSDAVGRAIGSAERAGGQVRPDPAAWAAAPAISIDYAVMEKAKNLAVVAMDAGWSDLGDWAAVWRESQADRDGVATRGDVTALDCRDALIRSDAPGVTVAALGLEDIVLVATSDAVLAAPKSRAQEVRRLADAAEPSARYKIRHVEIAPGGAADVTPPPGRRVTWTVVAGEVADGDLRHVAGDALSSSPGAGSRVVNVGDAPAYLVGVEVPARG